MASFQHSLKSGKKGSGLEHATYIAREERHATRCDLVATRHGNLPDWASDDPKLFWRMADRFERANGAVYREHEIALPSEFDRQQQVELADRLVHELVVDSHFITRYMRRRPL
jgi:hypothetical protein